MEERGLLQSSHLNADHHTVMPPSLLEGTGHPNKDENIPLRGSNQATWAGHNASRPIIQPHSPCQPLTQAAKHSRQISRLQRQEATQQLKKAVTNLIAEQAIKADAIADAHSVKSKWVKALIVGSTNYGSKCKSQLYNTLVSTKAQEVNSGKFLSSIFTTINSPPRSSGWGAPFPD